MYRKPLLTVEDAESLIGKLVRLEFTAANRTDFVGFVTRVASYDGAGGPRDYIFFDRANGSRGELLYLQGTWVVFATTIDSFIPADQEPTFQRVSWHDRDTLVDCPEPDHRPQSRLEWPAVDPGAPWHYEYQSAGAGHQSPTLDSELEEILRVAPAPGFSWTDGGIVVDELEDWERELFG